MKHQEKSEYIEEIFPKDLGSREIRMKWMQSKNWKKKLIEMIWYMNRKNTDMVSEVL